MGEKIKIIGIGDGGPNGLPALYEQWVHEADLLVGGERQLGFFPDYKGDTFTIKGNLRELKEKLCQPQQKTVVLASGDPLFFGIGSYLAKHAEVEIYPQPSSVQLAFARMGESWNDAAVISLHGRRMTGLAQRIDGKAKVALLTDESNSPQAIARYLASYGINEYEAFVAENLGGEHERCRWLALEDMETAEFSPLNVVILKRKEKRKVWPLGIPDEEFVQRKPDKGLLTKKEIRVLTIGQLALQKDSIVWDIGTCTGSVAIEAARVASEGAVYAIEKNEADWANAQENFKKFRTDVTAVLGKAPEGLESFPDPDAVFIGGTAGNMEGIFDECCGRLKDGGTIVMNVVTLENLSEAQQAFKKRGFQVDILLAQMARSKPILHLTRMEGLNPVYIITAKRLKEEQA
ncbi:bifunctional cobalt-precorrin-7 (C(5))-methyltransferase/cobalt-precorrin-6B (C(15))-methyltransferase [Bacillus badius]|uniref:Cobalt-precorrin-6y C5-methyltransferase n=1 Tax=Bacillus badius TaxID=1455 RepID=A0ABR5AWI0_BACBA|nr:bifunctional cobalt-precorrin-7 (C(5))-methyltransferase/cobalt-precorrin-6B (C(15))-methyltransferase [Bacillus badius]KIL74607.1 Cobalt-precorrin-6y C5-methyltransferase [Bacillus badius]KIL79072.1 Cobalt-precorrin-6y C5-methyltransferase [Bacillus badius]MED4715500.1 bifunctional cobalt-precorrin-7 (C(5))-methyltransferase/cobalt-precorrin-6B (C(15))-methyltransferase [Bacillus badius]